MARLALNAAGIQAFAGLVLVLIAHPVVAQVASPAPVLTLVNAFGSRDPQGCPLVTNTPTPSQAAQLVKCFREAQSRTYSESLVDDVVVTSMSPSRYDPRVQTGFTNMDTNVAPLAIRGSLVAWQCGQADGPGVMARYSNVGKNCRRWIEPNASGYCFKTRTGAWTCAMNDFSNTNPQTQDGLPPPT